MCQSSGGIAGSVKSPITISLDHPKMPVFDGTINPSPASSLESPLGLSGRLTSRMIALMINRGFLWWMCDYG